MTTSTEDEVARAAERIHRDAIVWLIHDHYFHRLDAILALRDGGVTVKTLVPVADLAICSDSGEPDHVAFYHRTLEQMDGWAVPSLVRQARLLWAHGNQRVQAGTTPWRRSGFGRECVAAMHDLGIVIVIDLAHAPVSVFTEVVGSSRRPVVVSHGGPTQPHPGSGDMTRAHPAAAGSTHETWQLFIDELGDVSRLPLLTLALEARGYPEPLIRPFDDDGRPQVHTPGRPSSAQDYVATMDRSGIDRAFFISWSPEDIQHPGVRFQLAHAGACGRGGRLHARVSSRLGRPGSPVPRSRGPGRRRGSGGRRPRHVRHGLAALRFVGGRSPGIRLRRAAALRK